MPENLLPEVEVPEEAADDRAAREIRQRLRQAGIDFVDSHQWCFQRLWNSPGVTPQRILAKLGPAALEIFQRGGDAVAFILGATTGRPIASMEPAEYTPPLPYTAHPDGTITIDES